MMQKLQAVDLCSFDGLLDDLLIAGSPSTTSGNKDEKESAVAMF